MGCNPEASPNCADATKCQVTHVFLSFLGKSIGVLPFAVLPRVPVHWIARFLRNFLLWSLQPGEKIQSAFIYGLHGEDDPRCAGKRASLFPYFVHGCRLLVISDILLVFF